MNRRLGSTSLKSLILFLLLESEREPDDGAVDDDLLPDRGVGVLTRLREELKGVPGEGHSSDESSASVESFGDLRNRSSQDARRPCSLSGDSGSLARRFLRNSSLHLPTCEYVVRHVKYEPYLRSASQKLLASTRVDGRS